MKYGGEGMHAMMVMLYNWIWKNECAPKRWREGVVVNLFKKGDKADPGNYPRIMLFCTVEKGISCPQFSEWSIFLVVNFDWWRILGRHLSSSGIVKSLVGKNINLEKWPRMMTSVYFFWKIDRKKFSSEHVLFRQIFYQRGKKS